MQIEAFWSCLTTSSCLASSLMGGLSSAAILFLVASGLSLVFGVLGVLNFAHGSLYMLGAYFGFWLTTLVAGDAGFWIALLFGGLIVAVLGAILEVGFLRRVYRLDLLYQILLTYAFVLIFDSLVKVLWGPSYKSIEIPSQLKGSLWLFGESFPIYHVVLIFIALAVIGGLWALITRTKWGVLVRAAAADSTMASALGVNVPLVWTFVFALGAYLGGLGGLLAAPLRSLFPGMGLDVVVQSFIVVVIGGLGSLPGAALGALLIGVLRAFGVLVLPNLELAFIYILMALVLIVRPSGLLGRRTT
jgi:branched-subunit amino acid ABC-type transport system permease component